MDKAALLKDLRKQVTALEDDLRARTESVNEYRTELEREYAAAREASRTAATYGAWRDERVTQAAAAWVLATVFVRFCEDNGLVDDPFIAGSGERLADAEDRQAAFFREKPELNDRDWLVAGFDHLSGAHKAVAGLFDRGHNALWELSPSYEAATRLLGFWRERGADGEIIHDFTDEELDTRFLGDLYQDLSEHARKTYALLQTPEFVEEFILDLTLEPAVEEFGLDPAWKHKPAGWPGDEPVVRGLRCIDPACGSGHFLLGMFERLLKKWREAEPGTEDWELVRRSLESVHGCDKNPFAVAIARFRMLVAVLKACGERRLVAAPEFPINVAVGDSLLHGRGAETVTETLFSGAGDDEDRTFAFRTEDVWEFADRVDLLGRGSYHVVVGNPPYITVKDKQENENYRKAYDACAGAYALSVPFAQRIFELAVRAGGSRRDGGFTGQITANSFMKREFGKKMIEKFFPHVDLTHVIDTSGAYIPGHGTPTVILIGRNRMGLAADRIRAVMGVRGEPVHPEHPAFGLVWSAIVRQVNLRNSDSEWVSVLDFPRVKFSSYPWSLAGGGAVEVFEAIERSRAARLGQLTDDLGFVSITGDDDTFVVPRSFVARDRRISSRSLVSGERVRDVGVHAVDSVIWPYGDDLAPIAYSDEHPMYRRLWVTRTNLLARKRFGVPVSAIEGMLWTEFREFYSRRIKDPHFLVYPFVATHNHFSFIREEVACIRTAPVIKLREGATEDQYLELLGVLNSSTACFWLKQVSHNKGRPGAEATGADEPWEHRFEFTGTKLQDFPLPVTLPLELGRGLDSLAQKLARHEPSAIAERGVLTRASLDEARSEYVRVKAQMVALQEELDWAVYGAYGLMSGDEVVRTTLPRGANGPGVEPSERAFAIVLARAVAAGETNTSWFAHHNHQFPTLVDLPAHWSDSYKAVVEARIEIITSRKDVALIERPEHKRRWASETWEKKEKTALQAWLLDRCEGANLWYGLRDGMRQPRALTVSQLADALRSDAEANAVAELYAADHLGKRDASLATVLTDIIVTEHVPYLASMRYRDSGLRKRAQWEQVWDLQREEDRTGNRLDIPVPPKYTSTPPDFLKASYWMQRGKLDVPKERFISYPDASPDSDPTLLLGWAGWDHKDQVQALVNVINDRTEQAGWESPRLTPLIAGIQELMPWVHQWHGEYDEEWDGTPAEEYQAYLDEQRAKHGLSAEDLTAWRPEKKTRGRAKKAD
ncbi:BREX-2 system adenine-specific DNA-methyltransferase PglX [Streptomyces sp. NPDC005786]|uniref:BREX-2 system adenine-specific DNA-methyltransferase PglX n=1 Tax=Streptomyces sp. NPDC005786 TaxID=3154891 RepID=UPI003410F570